MSLVRDIIGANYFKTIEENKCVLKKGNGFEDVFIMCLGMYTSKHVYSCLWNIRGQEQECNHT